MFEEIVDGRTDGRRRGTVSAHNSSPRAFGSDELTIGPRATTRSPE